MCLSQGVQKWHVVTYSNYLFSSSLGNLTGQSLIKHHTYRSGYLHEQDCWFHIPKTWTSVPAGKCSCILCWPGLQRLSSSPKPTARGPRVSPQIKGTILRELPTVWKTFVWKAELHIWNRGYHLGIRSAHVHLNVLILKIKSHDILFQCICRVSDSSHQFALVKSDLLSCSKYKYLSNCFTALFHGSYMRMTWKFFFCPKVELFKVSFVLGHELTFTINIDI